MAARRHQQRLAAAAIISSISDMTAWRRRYVARNEKRKWRKRNIDISIRRHRNETARRRWRGISAYYQHARCARGMRCVARAVRVSSRMRTHAASRAATSNSAAHGICCAAQLAYREISNLSSKSTNGSISVKPDNGSAVVKQRRRSSMAKKKIIKHRNKVRAKNSKIKKRLCHNARRYTTIDGDVKRKSV